MGYTYVVPNDVCLLKIKAWGAGGGGGGGSQGGKGGGGGYAEALVYVTPGEFITIFVGCPGTKGQLSQSFPVRGTGGFGFGWGGNGGGNISSGGGNSPDPTTSGGGGGGSTAVAIGTNVIVVAPGGGGGGGGNMATPGGNGGGGGNNGMPNSCVSTYGIYGGNVIKDGADGAMPVAGTSGGGGGGGGGFTNGGTGGTNSGNNLCPPSTMGSGGTGGGSGNGYAIPATGYPVVSSFTMAAPAGTNTCANATDPDLPAGFANGGNANNDGKSGYVVLIKMNTAPPPVANISYNNPLCEKDTLKLSGSGGVNYLWSGPNSFTSNAQNPVIPNVSTSASGTYSLLTQSIDGCISITSKNITVKNLPPPSTVNTPLCETSTLNLVGGGSAISYTWTGPNGFSANTQTTSIPNISISQSGNYYYFAQGANGCVRKDTHNVIVNPNPHSVLSATNVSCFGYADGIATTTPTIGTSPFFYLWNTGQNTQTINNLPPNTYTVRVTDANGCIAFGTVSVNEPLPITSTVSSKDVDCYNTPTGSATIQVNGGTPPYSYTWNPSGINSATASNISAGNYAIIVKDANNCIHTNSVIINQPPQINAPVSFTPVTCYGYSTGIISTTVSGGTPPLTYTWLPINISSSNVSNLPAGNYTLIVKDNNNCIVTNTLNLPQPPPILVNTSSNYTICYGQSTNIYAYANGGYPPYTYFWSDPTFTSTGPYVVSPTVSTTYSVYAKDNNNCQSSTQTIYIHVLPPLSGIGNTITVCDKDTAVLGFTLTSPGNGGPYAYDWHNGISTPTMQVIGNYANNPQTYTVTISDGCTVPDANIIVTLSIHPLPKGYFTTDKKDGCEPLNVQYTAISTSTNDTYQWTFETGLSSNGNNVNVLYNTGIYSATLLITNQYGCKIDTMSIKDVTVYPKPIADFTYSPSSINNYEPIVTFINQSVGGTFFQWNFGDPLSNANLSNELSPIHYYERDGEYTVGLFVMNEFDCRDSVYKTVKINPDFAVYIPNVFTPDGDGLNDTFNVKGIGISEKNFLMRIFNRWGMLIYSTEDIHQGWDGTYKGQICEDGIYAYYIEVMVENSNKKLDIRTFKGHVALLNKEKAKNY